MCIATKEENLFRPLFRPHPFTKKKKKKKKKLKKKEEEERKPIANWTLM